MQKKGRGIKWIRRLLRVLIVSTGLFIIACLIFDHFVQARKSDKELRQIFTARKIDGRIAYYNTHGRSIRYASVGNDSLPALLMLHGSPGSMSYYSSRFADTLIREHFKVFTVDRPGYGYSGLGDPVPSILEQAEMIRPILDSLHKVHHPVIVTGGSYGASIACRLAMDHPELVDGLVLTGPAIGPGLEKIFWFSPIIEHWSIRWAIPRIFRSANTEKMHHQEELAKMLPLWEKIRIPVIYMQGENDELIDTANAGFAKKRLINAPYLDIRFMKDRGHRLAQFEWPAIRASIMEVYSLASRDTVAAFMQADSSSQGSGNASR